MGYAVVHMMKIKQGGVRGIQSHNRREKPPRTNPDIDPSRTEQNYDVLFTSDNTYWKDIKHKIDCLVDSKRAIRKDAVVLCNFVVTSDEQTMKVMSLEKQKRFFEESVKWFANRYGSDRIINATVHMDERTPHLHLGLVPITNDGRLSAKDLFTKKEMTAIQTEFVRDVGEKYGLERGKEGSERKHLSEQRFKLQTALEETEKNTQTAFKMAQKAIKIEHDIKSMIEEDKVLKSKIQGHKGVLQMFQEIEQIGEVHQISLFSKKNKKVEMTLEQANKLKEQAKAYIEQKCELVEMEKKLQQFTSIANQVSKLEEELWQTKKELEIKTTELNDIKSIVLSSEELLQSYNEQVTKLLEQEKEQEQQNQYKLNQNTWER